VMSKNRVDWASVTASAKAQSAEEAQRQITDMRIKPATRSAYQRHVDMLTARAEEMGEDLTADVFIRILNALAGFQRAGTSSANSYRSALAWHQRRNSLEEWAETDRVKLACKAMRYDGERRGAKRKPRGILTREILDKMKRFMSDPAYHAAMLCLETGCRPGEAFELAASCQRGGYLLIQRDKRDRCDGSFKAAQAWWKPLTPEGEIAVKKCEARAKEEGLTMLFEDLTIQAYRADFKQAKEKAGIDDSLEIVPHSARHGFVSRLSDANVPKAVRELCGMSLGTMSIYARPQAERQQRATEHAQTREAASQPAPKPQKPPRVMAKNQPGSAAGKKKKACPTTRAAREAGAARALADV
jgi:integrase